MNSLNRMLMVGGLAVVSLFSATSNATAAYSFSQITSNGNQLVASQLSLDVTDAGGGFVDFKISNTGAIASKISEIYIDTTPSPQDNPVGVSIFSGISIFAQSAGVSFSVTGVTPGDLPAGNSVSPQFNVTAGLSAGENANGNSMAIDPGEWITLRLTLANGKTFANAISALNGGPDGVADDIRVGLHVIAIGTQGGSESFINGTPNTPNGTPVPAPPAILLLGLGSLLMGIPQLRNRFRNRVTAA